MDDLSVEGLLLKDPVASLQYLRKKKFVASFEISGKATSLPQ